ncbi:PREDICTED: C-type lectin 37Db-like [Bactrocera latifrons]|uniref:Lectin subunit alpha n=1 Tax=Bactrocera latifrons TaxID=174628 RepID=A0A0K8V6A4_BACLA|nr:PREDICTED: C-type lectin 37Db-like [Bactrocera latifrons]
MMHQAHCVFLFFFFVNSAVYTTCSTAVQEGEVVDLHPFVKVGNKYYLVSTLALELNWYAAAHFCRSYDSDLLTIESLAEKNALFSHLKQMQISHMHTWTSSNDLAVEGMYMSLNSGRPMLYTFWEENEPNNANDSEDCVEVSLIGDSFTMNDNKCYEGRKHIICEKHLSLNARDSATKSESSCEDKARNCGLKKFMEIYQQSANIFNYRE